MASIPSLHLPKLVSWDEFEELTLAACSLKWGSSNLTRHGRQGQAQDGIDIYGHDELNRLVGVQCKNTVRDITKSIIDDEIKNAESFEPTILSLFIATSADADAELQKYVREISQKRLIGGSFTVAIMFWRDIVHDLSKDLKEIERFYPQFFTFTSQNPTRSQALHQHAHQHVHQYHFASAASASNISAQPIELDNNERNRDIGNLVNFLNKVDVESIPSYLNYAPKSIDEKFYDQNDYINEYLRNPALHYFDQVLYTQINNFVFMWNEIIELMSSAPYKLSYGKFRFDMSGDSVGKEHLNVYDAIDDKAGIFMDANIDFCQWIIKKYPEVDLQKTSKAAREFWASN
jgi:hypothetical protein